MKLKTVLFTLAAIAVGHAAWAEEEGGDSHALLQALPSARVTLQRGLDASAAQGRPISGKFEMEDGKLQLSVYTAKDGKFSEVIVDHTTGKVLKVEPINEGDDYKQAALQASAMADAKGALKNAADKAERANPGFRAVSATPDGDEGKVVVHVVIAKGGQSKTVTEKLE